MMCFFIIPVGLISFRQDLQGVIGFYVLLSGFEKLVLCCCRALEVSDLGFDMGIKYEYTEYGLYSDCSLIFL